MLRNPASVLIKVRVFAKYENTHAWNTQLVPMKKALRKLHYSGLSAATCIASEPSRPAMVGSLSSYSCPSVGISSYPMNTVSVHMYKSCARMKE